MDSYKSTADQDPHPYYRALRARGELVWDEAMNAWLVASLDAVKHVMRHDENIFRHPFKDMNEEVFLAISGAWRDIKFLSGEEHTRMHRWYLQALSQRNVARWREQLIVPVIDATIARFMGHERVALHREFSTRLPLRVLASLVGLPWQDEAWIAHVQSLMEHISHFYDQMFKASEEVIQSALAASRELNEIVLPFVLAKRAGDSDDMLGMLWRDGPGILDGWCEKDVVANCRLMMFAGSESTAHTTSNACYLLLNNPALFAQLIAGGEQAAAKLTEEVLRLQGSAHFRPRLANIDTEVAGTQVKKDQMLITLLAAANRDASKFERPDEALLDRPSARDHVAFNFGPRACVGAALARAELTEALLAVARRMPNMRWDTTAEAPRIHGFMIRSYHPLFVQLAG